VALNKILQMFEEVERESKPVSVPEVPYTPTHKNVNQLVNETEAEQAGLLDKSTEIEDIPVDNIENINTKKISQLFNEVEKEEYQKAVNPEKPELTRRVAVLDLMTQGIIDPSEILNCLNYNEKGNKIGDFTLEEIKQLQPETNKILDNLFNAAEELTGMKLKDRNISYFLMPLSPTNKGVPLGQQNKNTIVINSANIKRPAGETLESTLIHELMHTIISQNNLSSKMHPDEIEKMVKDAEYYYLVGGKGLAPSFKSLGLIETLSDSKIENENVTQKTISDVLQGNAMFKETPVPDKFNELAKSFKMKEGVSSDYSTTVIAQQLKEGTYFAGEKPETLKDTLGVYATFGKSLITHLPKAVAATILQAMQPDGASVADRDWADRYIKDASEDPTKFANEMYTRYGDKGFAGFAISNLSQLPQNMAYSITSMGAGLAAGIPIGMVPLPGFRVAAWAAGTAVSGAVAYRATKYQIMQQYLELKNEESIAKIGREITLQEETRLKEDFENQAHKYALWEAVPEAISNLAFVSLLTAPLTKMIGKTMAGQIVSKLVGMYGEELLTETITQMGQTGIEVKAGMREGKPVDWTSPKDWIRAFKEVTPQTFLLTTLMAGAGSTVIGAKDAVKKVKTSLRKEVGTNPHLYEALSDKLDAVEKGEINSKILVVPTKEEVKAETTLPVTEKPAGKAIVPSKLKPSQVLPPLYPGGPTSIVRTEKEIRAEAKAAGYYDFISGEVKYPEKFAKEEIKEYQRFLKEEVSQDFLAKIPNLKEIGIVERVRPSWRVFQKIGIYDEVFAPAFEAEINTSEDALKYTEDTEKLKHLVKNIKDAPKRIFKALEHPQQYKYLLPQEKKVADWFIKYRDDWADKLKLTPEERLDNYVTHIFEKEIEQALKEGRPVDPGIVAALDFITPTTIFNPYLQERLGRKAGLREDVFAAFNAYEGRALKSFYYEPLIQRLNTYVKYLPPNSARYLKEFITRITSRPLIVDKEVNQSLKEVGEVISKLPGGKKLATVLTQGNPSGMLSYQATGLLYEAWMGLRPLSGGKNLAQQGLTLAEVGPVAYAQALALKNMKERARILSNSLGLKSRESGYLPGIDETFIKQLQSKRRKVTMFMFKLAEGINTSNAFLSGYFEAKNKGLPEEICFQRGDEVIRKTQYLYTKLSASSFSQSSPGRIASAFTTWTINWMELMNDWIQGKPSEVYKEYEKNTGNKITPDNWILKRKALWTYLALVTLAGLIQRKTRIRAFDYVGWSSLRALADIVSGDIAGLKVPGAMAQLTAGLAMGDIKKVRAAWTEIRPDRFVTITRELEDIYNGKKDWMNLFISLEKKTSTKYGVQRTKMKRFKRK